MWYIAHYNPIDPSSILISKVTSNRTPDGVEENHRTWCLKMVKLLNPIFLYSQDRLRYQQMEQFCQTVEAKDSSLRCQVHQTALHRQRHRQGQLPVLQPNKLLWSNHKDQFTFRLFHSQLTQISSTSHRLCLTDPFDHHTQSRQRNCPISNNWTTEDYHQHLQETQRVRHQTIHWRQTTKSIRQLSWTRRTTIHHIIHRQMILMTSKLMSLNQLSCRFSGQHLPLQSQPPTHPTQPWRSSHRHVKFQWKSSANSKLHLRRSFICMREQCKIVHAHPTPNWNRLQSCNSRKLSGDLIRPGTVARLRLARSINEISQWYQPH